ncbi:hypothetical protein AB4865_02765 [Capnocytophaga sp. ARDL2]|uniref:hypothetical protein n=1 Tax=Capnocytophaga sp. ARDL2 TaxID=3238809 RepID=UPI0035561DCC
MKNKITFSLLLMGCLSNAQSLQFSYDANGNQIQRKLDVIEIQSFLYNSYPKEEIDSFSDNNENFEEIEVFPNPVIDWVTVQWI